MNGMSIVSPSFLHEHEIPVRHTCDGQDISPALNWADVPKRAKSLVLTLEDPDAPDPSAPKITWVHWLLYNIPVNETGLEEGCMEKNFPAGTLPGMNDWRKTAYGGPCPPIGRHRYFFKLYALDKVLPDLNLPDKSALEMAMYEHILAQATLVGLYKRYAVR